MSNFDLKRKEYIQKLFPTGIPPLWCPPLTHYQSDKSIDFERMKKHINHIAPYINSFLIPGSTGDGWEINFEEYKQILQFIFKDFTPKCEINVLIGLLRTEPEEMQKFLDYAIQFLHENNIKTDIDQYTPSRFKGFVLCAPKGKDLSQDEISKVIIPILEKNYPIVLYQLPQITENELSPTLISELAAKYPNFYMMKDSSGQDKVANAGLDYHGVVLLRGAEADYHKHLKASGGVYDGFLLSTGNTFAKELRLIVDNILSGEISKAEAESISLTQVINKVFEIAAKIPFGNAFTNSNKLLDHIFAYGNEWLKAERPLTHAGENLSEDTLLKVDKILKNSPYYPKKGYIM
ncbi:dihydrodipicolinate synthase family protein [Candidatus Harpocratesius sp.]